MGHMVERAQIVVKGIVQGVGFRPFVYNLAESLGLKGYVTNTSEGVFIDVEGAGLSAFARRLRQEAPPLSQITEVSVNLLPVHGYSDFAIHKSTDHARGLFTLVSPDVSICDDCLRELLDPSNRRYLYPFINCTNCGPRYSITKSVPYDRPNTTMAAFTLCPDCLSEYHDPRDRRFHAQPNACSMCGPHVEFRVQSSEFGVKGVEAIQEAINLLKQGGIIAVKGLGGFHIACDATNDTAVKRLRENKRKSNKPFAVMVPSVEAAEQSCRVSTAEKELLLSIRRPIVLLKKKNEGALPEAVSPHNQFIGIMLPYTPLHFLLFHQPLGTEGAIEKPHFNALVMTSGNLSEEPIVHENDAAVRKLGGLVDGFLFHDRDIFMRVDDSVVRVANADCGLRNDKHSELHTPNSMLFFIRRSRGYAPDPIALHGDGPEVMGCGADLKNTFTLTKGKFAITSQHIGDMENYETLQFFEESLANLKAVYRAEPVALAHDLHPGYLSTKWAIEQGARVKRQGSRNQGPGSGGKGQGDAECGMKDAKSDIMLFAIQHHYAHIGSVMAENGLERKVIGVAFDGTGYGTDDNLWGGEFLIADIDGFERAGQFNYMSLPGGEAAIREPWKTAVSCIMDACGEKAWDRLGAVDFTRRYGKGEIEKLMQVARARELSPLSSGAGRLFDAVAALLGICDRNTFEGEAAMALESFTRDGIEDEYQVEWITKKGYTVVDLKPAIIAMINELTYALPREVMATKFHNTVAMVIRTMARRLGSDYGLNDAALSGGTFQNQYLLNRTVRLLSSDGMNVFTNRKVPCNDGGISLGQAYLVRKRLKNCGMRISECKT
jgi:hydrogenase maturation protein HypF